jgi:hypothetical protein
VPPKKFVEMVCKAACACAAPLVTEAVLREAVNVAESGFWGRFLRSGLGRIRSRVAGVLVLSGNAMICALVNDTPADPDEV